MPKRAVSKATGLTPMHARFVAVMLRNGFDQKAAALEAGASAKAASQVASLWMAIFRATTG